MKPGKWWWGLAGTWQPEPWHLADILRAAATDRLASVLLSASLSRACVWGPVVPASLDFQELHPKEPMRRGCADLDSKLLMLCVNEKKQKPVSKQPATEAADETWLVISGLEGGALDLLSENYRENCYGLPSNGTLRRISQAHTCMFP